MEGLVSLIVPQSPFGSLFISFEACPVVDDLQCQQIIMWVEIYQVSIGKWFLIIVDGGSIVWMLWFYPVFCCASLDNHICHLKHCFCMLSSSWNSLVTKTRCSHIIARLRKVLFVICLPWLNCLLFYLARTLAFCKYLKATIALLILCCVSKLMDPSCLAIRL